jgi:hypothetical protein
VSDTSIAKSIAFCAVDGPWVAIPSSTGQKSLLEAGKDHAASAEIQGEHLVFLVTKSAFKTMGTTSIEAQ